MITNKIKNSTVVLKDENIFLSVIMGYFLILPVLYVVYLELTLLFTNVSFLQLLNNDVNASLNLVSNFSAVYSAYAIYNIKKNRDIKENRIAFYLVLLGQLFQVYTITIVIMFIYVYKFIGIKQIISSIKELEWGKSYKALFSSVTVCLISLFVMIIRIKIIM
ncbi:hypothetical protein ACTPEO_04645 [Clostridioides difficile]